MKLPAWAALALAACASAAGPSDTPPEAYARYLEGKILLEEGEAHRAVTAFQRAAVAAGGSAEPRIAAADALLQAGRPALALAEAETVVAGWPDEPRGWALLGRIRAHQGDLVGGAQALERAVALDATNEGSHLALASIYRRLRRATDAVAIYRRMVASLPASAEGHFRLGQALAGLRLLDEASDELGRAVAIDPDHIDAQLVWAEVARQKGETSRAEEILRIAYQRSGDSPYVGERLYHVLLEAGRRDAALELLHNMDGEGRDARVRMRVAHFFLQLHRPAEALSIAAALPGGALIRAQALARLGRTQEAVQVCRDVLPETEAFADARALAGEILARAGAPADGLALVEEAARLERSQLGRRKLAVAQAEILERLGAVARARDVLDAALREAPADESVAFARARLAEHAGDPDGAVDIMRRVLDRDADNVLALNYIGMSYADRGVRLDASERLLRRALQLVPDDGTVLDSYGWLLFQRGDLAAAADLLERADRLAPFEPEILFHLGELYLRRGEARRAAEKFREALALDPDARVRLRLEERVRTLEARGP
ncbi:MAG TPA: tetratricopeptide repeat protein [Haliangiales bacterium]|nr:tetratricopeptide repeat protein [Haliangiales bacterium]